MFGAHPDVILVYVTLSLLSAYFLRRRNRTILHPGYTRLAQYRTLHAVWLSTAVVARLWTPVNRFVSVAFV